FSYPLEDKALDRIVLVDVDTARALNGYLYGTGSSAELSDDDNEALSGNLSDLFGGDTEDAEPTEEAEPAADTTGDTDSAEDGDTIDPNALFSDDQEGSDEEEAKVLTEKIGSLEGAWNFLLVSLHNKEDADTVASHLASEDYTKDEGFLVRDWSSSVGGNAQLSWYLQVVFNIGLLFVTVGAIIIAANALLLSILERTNEIGTLRAVGATRFRIALMVFLETLCVVFASAVIGIIIGSAATFILNASDLVLDNQYIKILFGGKPVRGDITPEAIAGHLGTALFLTVVSMLYPLKRALSISPVEAMRE
ncbi:MAG: ABC transporter permease, partial [Spirochaetaceae bacterium]